MQGKLVLLLLVAALYVASAKAADVGVHKCPAHEEWNLCGKICEPSCSLPNPKLCPRLACTKFTAACRCQKGYVRTVPRSGRCVRQKQCSKA